MKTMTKAQILAVSMMLSASLSEFVNEAEIASAYEIANKDMKGEL